MAAVGGSGGSAVYGLKYGARCVSAVLGSTDAHRFLVGTNSCRDRGALNEVHCIEFDDDDNAIRCKAVYAHPAGEVWALTPAPTKPELFVTAYRPASSSSSAAAAAPSASAAAPATPPQVPGAASASAAAASSSSGSSGSGDDYRVSLWKMKEEKNEALSKLEEVVELKGHSGAVRSVVWNATDESRIVTCDGGAVRLWTLNTGAAVATASATSTAAGGALNAIGGCAWDPHRPQEVSVVNGSAIHALDLRTMKQSVGLANAHGDTIRDVDYNPNKPSYVVTAGDDRKIKFWDVRKFAAPLRVLTGHTHWVSTVKYNRAHDQLVLSGGCDASVKLWSIVSISSAPLGELEDPANQREGDKLVKTYDEHEDSVYAVSWSAKDAWVFASVSHGGQVVCNHVPQPEKYKILL